MRTLLNALGNIGILLALAIAFSLGLLATLYVSLRSPEVTVPELVGKNRSAGEETLTSIGLNLRQRATRYNAEAKPDTILDQSPRAGETVKSGQTVAVVVSRNALREGEVAPPSGENQTPEQTNGNANQNANQNANGQTLGGNQNSALNTNRRNVSRGNTNANSNNRNANANNSNANVNANNRNQNGNRSTNGNRNANASNQNNRNAAGGANRNANVNANRRPPVTTTPPFNPNANRRNP